MTTTVRVLVGGRWVPLEGATVRVHGDDVEVRGTWSGEWTGGGPAPGLERYLVEVRRDESLRLLYSLRLERVPATTNPRLRFHTGSAPVEPE